MLHSSKNEPEKISRDLNGLFMKQLFCIFCVIFLCSCDGRTPAEYDQDFKEKFNACMARVQSKCTDEDENVCQKKAVSRCEAFLGTKENPVVK